MRRIEIPAAYWGGVPDGPLSADGGLLGLTDSGVIDYDWYDASRAAAIRRTAVMLLPNELIAVSTNAGDLGIGAAVDRADLKVLCERDGVPCIAIFAAAPADARAFMRAIRDQRASVGERSLPTIESLLDGGTVGHMVDRDGQT